MPTHSEFLRDRFGGSDWVLARRTKNIVRRYGEDVRCISPKQYVAVEKEYRALYGDPHDKVRAQMYMALLAAREQLNSSCDTDTLTLMQQLGAAIEAERNAK